jgi:hypothetical protein
MRDENPGPGDLSLYKEQHSIMNHIWSNEGSEWVYEYHNAVLWNNITHLDLTPVIPQFVWDIDYLATLAAARSNPSRPEVSIPQFVGELKDLPKAIYRQGKKGIEWAKSDSLGVRFGILPMISDVLKLMNFKDKVAKRDNEFERLQSGKGLKRRIKLATAKRRVPLGAPNCLPSSGPNGFTAEKITEFEVWASVRWKPGGVPMLHPPGSDERSAFIKATLHGTSERNDIYSYARDVWEIVPWSWMVDWFANCGDYLDANRNQDTAQMEEVWVMRKQSTRVVTQGNLGNYVSSLVTKERYRGYVSLSVNPRPLSPDQVAILGGLAVKDPRHKLPKRFLFR